MWSPGLGQPQRSRPPLRAVAKHGQRQGLRFSANPFGLAARDERLLEEELAAAQPDPKRISDLEDSAGKHHTNAAAMAEKVTPYRYPKLSAIKIAQRNEDDLTDKTLEQLQAEIFEGFKQLQASGAFAKLIDADEPRELHIGRRRTAEMAAKAKCIGVTETSGWSGARRAPRLTSHAPQSGRLSKPRTALLKRRIGAPASQSSRHAALHSAVSRMAFVPNVVMTQLLYCRTLNAYG